MGEEIAKKEFKKADYQTYIDQLKIETEHLKQLFEKKVFAADKAMCGVEQEAWITDRHHIPAAENQVLLDEIDSNLLSPELARFNIELNVNPQSIAFDGLARMQQELSDLWSQCESKLHEKNMRLFMVGILPTVRDSELVVENMSRSNRFQALNEQILKSRKGKPLHLNIVGVEQLKSEHYDVMLESAATSFQIHRQIPSDKSKRYYNASIIVSAAMVALCANSPFLFGRSLWDETRIPLFEQAVETGGYGDAANGPIWRVTFGSGYARQSIMEVFQENLEHYPVLLPVALKDSTKYLSHLRMHNGTIWRWNRPLIGFDADDLAYFRIENRVTSAGPTLIDEMANAAFFYGLHEYYSSHKNAPEDSLAFSDAKDNFYHAAQHGLHAKIKWLDGKKWPILTLLSSELLKNAEQGLNMLDVKPDIVQQYLGVIKARLLKKQSGAEWQKKYAKTYGYDMNQLAARYLELQTSGNPVHDWNLS